MVRMKIKDRKNNLTKKQIYCVCSYVLAIILLLSIVELLPPNATKN